MKANVKKHVIIGTLSAVCVALVCVIGTQFRSDIPSVENVAEESTEAEIKVEIVTNAKEKNEPAETESKTVNTETSVETGEIQYNDFIDNGGIKVDQSFEQATKPEAPPAPEITDESVLTNPSEPPQYESEQVEIKPQVTETPSDTPQHGDKKDGMIYINGFGWVVDNGGGGVNEYVYDMYENGNKIGYFG
ncbi:MAG: hypothetical protein NC452_19825 [Eubacterium sp.]|nr:hypothetical protein [Eubacterium sp.]MCM1062506.1 hypothetical protein [Eubacterium sp.]